VFCFGPFKPFFSLVLSCWHSILFCCACDATNKFSAAVFVYVCSSRFNRRLHKSRRLALKYIRATIKILCKTITCVSASMKVDSSHNQNIVQDYNMRVCIDEVATETYDLNRFSRNNRVCYAIITVLDTGDKLLASLHL